jgi:hypothetical protein
MASVRATAAAGRESGIGRGLIWRVSLDEVPVGFTTLPAD